MPRFCALSYTGHNEGLGHLAEPFVIALVIFNDKDELRVFVSPLLQGAVAERDWHYVEALFDDFPVRAKSDQDALFRQLSSLSVGPIVTGEVGSCLADYPHLADITKNFVPFRN